MCDGVDRGEQSEDLVCTERDMVINVVLDRDGRLLLDHFVDVGDFQRRWRHVRGEGGTRCLWVRMVGGIRCSWVEGLVAVAVARGEAMLLGGEGTFLVC